MKIFKSIIKKIQKSYYLHIMKNPVKYARKLGVKIGNGCIVLDDPASVFGNEPYLVQIGDNVEITGGVKFITHEGSLWVLRHYDSFFSNKDSFGKITIGNNVFIGADSILLNGIEIGNNVIIGAHSVVSKSFGSNVVIAGIPAKVICSLEEYISKRKNEVLLDTKSMSPSEKKKTIKISHPEWFD